MIKYILPLLILPGIALAQFKLEKLQDGIFRFQNKFHYSLVIAGKKSLFVADPLGERWSRLVEKKN